MASTSLTTSQKTKKGTKKSKLDNFGSKRHTLTDEDREEGTKKAASLRTIKAEEHRNFVIAAKAYNIPVEFFDAIDKKQWKKGELLLKAMEKAGFDDSSSEDAANRKQKVELSGKVDSKLEIEVTGVEVG